MDANCAAGNLPEVLNCGSPLLLSTACDLQIGRGLLYSKTLARWLLPHVFLSVTIRRGKLFLPRENAENAKIYSAIINFSSLCSLFFCG